jgi:alpha-D-xyloside xylohydrolase
MRQTLKEIRIYPGRTVEFTLYDDDGITYEYEKGQGRVTRLHWDDQRGQLSAKGAAPAGGSLAELTKVVH